MSEALSSISGFFTNAAPAITGATAGAGLIGNIMNSITRGKAVGNMESAEKKFGNLTPEQLSGLVNRAEQPLDASLVQTVNNQVQGDMASRGLAESPGVFAATEAQAIAPFKQQQQQVALQLIMKQLGLPIEYAQAILGGTGGNSDVTNAIMQLLLRQNNPSGGNQIPQDPAGADPTAAIIQQIIAMQGAPPLPMGSDFPSTQPGGG